MSEYESIEGYIGRLKGYGRDAALDDIAAWMDGLAESPGRIQLCAGEMTAGELRTVKAILAYCSRRARNMKQEGMAPEQPDPVIAGGGT